MTVERPVTVVKRRWETSTTDTFTFDATVIDEDGCGVWFRTEPLTFHRGSDGRVVYISTHTWLGLVPRNEPWLAMFAGGNWKVDVCLPPVVTAGTIEFCDLELDVDIRMPRTDHPARIVDRDEFEALGLPPDLAADCDATALAVQQAITMSEPPFDAGLERRIAEVVGADTLVAAGDLVRLGWISPATPFARDHASRRFGADVVGEAGPGALFAGSLGEVYAIVDDGGVVAVHDTSEARQQGLDTLVGLTVEASRRLETASVSDSGVR